MITQLRVAGQISMMKYNITYEARKILRKK